MIALVELSDLIGKWQGIYQLWLTPLAPVRESESFAEINTISQKQLTDIQYSWTNEGELQEGRLVLGRMSKSNVIQAIWLDTWHMLDIFMFLQGNADEKGTVRVEGSYTDPPGPDWGWEIVIQPEGKDAFRFLMYNINPEGEKFLAVVVAYSRQ